MPPLTKRIVDDRIVLAVILINTIALFLDAFASIHQTHGRMLYFIDYACTVFFVFEMVIKLFTLGVRQFWANSWNVFDFVIVFFSSPVLISPFGEVGDLSFIIMLRLARLLRYFRLLAFIPNQRHIIGGILRALRASVGVFTVVILYILILSIGAVYLFRDTAPEFFGDPLTALYTTFRIFTNDGWHEIPDLIASRSSELMGIFARAYFVFTVFTASIFGLSLANAVFVDQMVSDNTDAIDKKLDGIEQQLKKMQESLDRIAKRDDVPRQ
jgi:voltage-gated sodium channel